MHRPHRVVVLALNTVTLFDAAIPLQVFGHPDQRDHYAVSLCALEAGPVRSLEGTTLLADDGLEAVAGAETVIVPGFSPRGSVEPAALDALRAAAARGARVASICSGAFALAEAGLLDHRTATTHWVRTAELQERYPNVEVEPDVLYVEGDDGLVATSAGLAAGLDLCLALVRQDHGADAASVIARRLVVAAHRTGGQTQLLDQPLPDEGDSVAEACAWARQHLAERLTVPQLAARAGFAPRTFTRRFREQTGTTPAQWLTHQRLMEACRLLEHTTLTVDLIAERTGLGTATNLRTLLGRDAHVTPTAYRRAHRDG